MLELTGGSAYPWVLFEGRSRPRLPENAFLRASAKGGFCGL